MIAVDTNILVYAHRRQAPQFQVARAVLAELAGQRGGWAIPWPCVHEFIGIVTHPKIFAVPSTLDQALEQVEAWWDSGTLTLLAEDIATWPVLRSLLRSADVAGPQMHDAKIAAICIAHGVRELWTADRDFSRFPRLRTRNPLGEPRL